MGITPAAIAQPYGGYSDYAYVLEAKALPVPSPLSFEEAAGFVIPFRTAHQALAERVEVRPLALVEQGAIRTPVSTVSGFEEVTEVLSRLASGGPAGKHIIRVS